VICNIRVLRVCFVIFVLPSGLTWGLTSRILAWIHDDRRFR